jgi:phage shock protein PspC (stress-responsive transcriptional regulator)
MNIDPAIVRLLFAIITFGGFGTGIIIYIILWIVLPVRSLDTYIGKRFYRNPDDKVISGVAGGLAAYFDKPSWAFRLIFAAPLLLNILFGVLNGIFFMWERDIFPNFFIGSFSGTFVLAYIILWIVLPEANSPFEKMEMRGEKVDVNRIRQNVQEGMGDFNTRMKTWGSEVRESAERLGEKAKEFTNTRGKAFASELGDTTRPAANGCLHIIFILFKAFAIFVIGCVALSLFAALMAVLFGGIAWWPINNFLWTSSYQKFLAWGTLLFFFAVPVIGLMVWLVRRIARVRSRNRYLGWVFGGLWTFGWACAVLFAISVAKDVRSYERTETSIPIEQPSNNKLFVKVNEPQIRYSGGAWWIREENTGWDISEDSMKYTNVKLRVAKSEDSLYHVSIFKYSAGKNVNDAMKRAEQIVFRVSSQDSLLNIASGLGIHRSSKFRGQGVMLVISVPVGKQINFDESLRYAYNPWIVRKYSNYGSDWDRRNRYEMDWNYDEHLEWKPGVDYIMTTKGDLLETAKTVIDSAGVHMKKTEEDKLKENRDKQRDLERQLEESKREEERLEKERQDKLRRDSLSGGTGFIRQGSQNSTIASSHISFVPLII